MIKSVWKDLGGVSSEKQSLTENVNFYVEVFLTVTFVFSSDKIGLDTCSQYRSNLHSHHLKVTKSRYFDFNTRSAIIFHRFFPHTTLYFQDIYLLFSNELDNKVLVQSVEARDFQPEVFDKAACDKA